MTKKRKWKWQLQLKDTLSGRWVESYANGLPLAEKRDRVFLNPKFFRLKKVRIK